LGNIFFLKKFSGRVPELSILTLHSQIHYREDCDTNFHAPAGSPCGFFGLPVAVVSSNGLRYEMQNHALELGSTESVANSFIDGEIHLRIVGQCLISISIPGKNSP
jgi:thiamine pyrophosphokinase